MDNARYSNYFLIFILSVLLVVVYLIFQPFLPSLVVAAVFAFFFKPLYRKILRILKERKSLAAFLTTIIACVLILVPVTLLGNEIFAETSQTYVYLTHEGKDIFPKSLENIIIQIRAIVPIPENFDFDLSQYMRRGLELLIQAFVAVFSSFAKTLLDLFVFVIALYYLLKDGHRLKNYFVALSPLDDKDDDFILERLQTAVVAVVKGNLTVGIIQGAMTGIGFAVFGVPNAVLWGVVAAMAALVPGFGTSLVLAPAIVFLFLSGNAIGGFGLLAWGITAVGLIDNFLGPKLIGRGMMVHPLAVFLAVLGGLAFFGPIGFIVGPLIISICLSLIEIRYSLRGKQNKKQN